MFRLLRLAAVLAVAALLLANFAALGAEDDRAAKEAAFRRSLATVLEKSEKFELYSLSVDRRAEQGSVTGSASSDDKKLLGWPVLGKIAVSDRKLRGQLAADFVKSAHCFNDRECLRPKCFQPRHAIRIERDGKNIDFVICFECLQVKVSGNFPEFMVSGEAEPAFDAVLKTARIALSRDLEKQRRTR